MTEGAKLEGRSSANIPIVEGLTMAFIPLFVTNAFTITES